MPILSGEIMAMLAPFAQVFSARMWDWVQVLVVGAILAPGKRTVSALLRVMGRADEAQFQNYHRVLNRARWSSLALSRILLGLLVATFTTTGVPLVLAADETLERRKGDKLTLKGSFRDPLRSSAQRNVASWGLRWVSMMLLVRPPWSRRVWALPFLTLCAPHAATHAALGKRHKTSIDWLGQMIQQVRRWLPQRELVLVVDGGLAAVKLGWKCVQSARGVTLVSRLLLNAGLYDAPTPRRGRGRQAKKGTRQPKLKERVTAAETVWERVTVQWYGGVERVLELATGTAVWYTPGQNPLPVRWVLVRDPLGVLKPQAFFATNQAASAQQIVEWFVLRWQVEVTFQEVRAHLGFETQRQWNDLAVARTTPVLLALFAWVTLVAHHLSAGQPLPVATSAWYHKREATFADALALVRRHLWSTTNFNNPLGKTSIVAIPTPVLHGLVELLCYAA